MRKNSKSSKKQLRRKSPQKKQKCKKCQKSINYQLSIKSSLANKYALSQRRYHYLPIFDGITMNQQSVNSTKDSQAEQCLQKYYNRFYRKQLYPKIKQVYKLHTNIPRIFQPNIKQVLDKCYHRKRLLEYFKIAKILGIKVQSVKFSSFLLSLNQTKKNPQSFDKIISKISFYDFSQDPQKKLISDLEGTESKSTIESHHILKNI